MRNNHLEDTSVQVVRAPADGGHAASNTESEDVTVPTVVADTRARLGDRAVWHISSTAVGGGIAELLRTAVDYHAVSGIRCGWLVPEGNSDFFHLTKQLHHHLHGSAGPGLSLSPEAHDLYTQVTTAQARATLHHLSPGDLVVLHDPQTLGMAPILVRAGMRVAWRSHIGTTTCSPLVQAAWDFLAPFLAWPLRCVFSSPSYVPAQVGHTQARVIYPTIDPDSPKCRSMPETEVHDLLSGLGLQCLRPERSRAAEPAVDDYLRHRTRVLHDEPLPPQASVVLQLARWDPLKDMLGVLEGFVHHIAPVNSAHLILAGPDPDDIPDDPENAAVFAEIHHRYSALPVSVRRRIHLVVLGLANTTQDLQANAVLVNALQRRASVICQKSLHEGFGLAVTEAMWKHRPVVASAVGGICEQLTPDVHGLLLEDPTDLAAFGNAVTTVLTNEAVRQRMTQAAYARCTEMFLQRREMTDYAQLYAEMLSASAPTHNHRDGDHARP